ncbi:MULTISPECIES: type 1 glutamine amidotransferase domain-containing protein [Modicisalibacter]|uniref:type 1 glutamine amidotransferase domain-containing protein n=1 Tax=Modicisalibacter TaxID=574347 RepID=UPI00100A2D9F|nr:MULTISPECIES: type 1 glutamine amidotransferase domain-containing protein [Halomonadaceae]MBZ9560220.1 type 1 glutamine amidotransferase domain-containing protein [Modicisalibacter sp. R2A 31.J]MBZ9576128.1 type 1 glutamine amidotransferase domain-containing protein [Modicisalibacter sp. MOD 31.J]
MKILMVLTSHDSLGDTGQKTGFWLEEFAAPYYVFKDAGAEITLASPAGGQPPVDPNSTQEDALTEATRRFEQDDAAREQLANTRVLATVNPEDFDAVFFPGGHGPLWDLTGNADAGKLIQAFLAAEKPVAAVCHAPTVLLEVRDEAGKPVVEGRRVTGFTNSEEAAVGLTEVVPHLLEDELVKRGARFERSEGDFTAFTLRDGLLITGQNPASSAPTADLLLHVLRQ